METEFQLTHQDFVWRICLARNVFLLHSTSEKNGEDISEAEILVLI